ncbi:MAG: NAD(P)H-dependent oxidoreductase [Bacteroidota bacterium]
MITVISGTNRPNSRTLLVASYFKDLLRELGQEVRLLDLAALDTVHYAQHLYEADAMSPELIALQDEFILSADKMVIFTPEYNGSYAGVLKLFIDGISVREYKNNFGGKKIALTGVASGRAGNLRGLEHLAGVLAYLGAWILPNKLPVSSVETLLEDDRLTDEDAITALKLHAKQLIEA